METVWRGPAGCCSTCTSSPATGWPWAPPCRPATASATPLARAGSRAGPTCISHVSTTASGSRQTATCPSSWMAGFLLGGDRRMMARSPRGIGFWRPAPAVRRATRSHAEAIEIVMRSPPIALHRRALPALVAALLGVLACSRSDVPPPRGIGSGGEPALQQPVPSTSPLPADNPTPAPEPTATETPAAPEPVASPTFPPTPTLSVGAGSESVLYRSQPGDALRTVAVRFGVLPEDIAVSGAALPEDAVLLDPVTLLIIPRRLGATGPAELVIPDSEVVYSPHAAEFDVSGFVQQAGGYLQRYRETVSGRSRTGAEVVALAARDHSVNPRLLLAFLEYYAGWGTNPKQPISEVFRYPLGHNAQEAQGLYRQLSWLSNELGEGYYGWRARGAPLAGLPPTPLPPAPAG